MTGVVPGLKTAGLATGTCCLSGVPGLDAAVTVVCLLGTFLAAAIVDGVLIGELLMLLDAALDGLGEAATGISTTGTRLDLLEVGGGGGESGSLEGKGVGIGPAKG